ncbi:MAG: 4-(cytidine 5'-diphospho)-2-C-methyl-D-erythritol kinase [Syntrophobacterales bacterium GWC2_56_13]|nr:MAG: 4-(cytidine 5'-diphospho)-2-C-methyl-D-erythritol kinase [Syntrophobacterales bacterium GWC2_56_13]
MITKASPAKINLYLRVLRKRKDGYHDLLSLMQRISLFDELTFSPGQGRILVRCPGAALPEDEGNIVYRAAAAFFSRIASPSGVEITIRKRIPVAAGLGGGSSNAATTLMTLNELSGSPLTRKALMRIGAGLGADIPFFIFEKTAWASGIGNRLVEAPPLPPLWFVLINPGFEISTKMVYQKLNLGLTSAIINYSIPRFYTADDLIRGLTNDLENVTVGLHPVIDHFKVLLMNNGARGALMSGSGPTVFGIFTDEESAFAAEKNLKQKNRWSVLGAHSL